MRTLTTIVASSVFLVSSATAQDCTKQYCLFGPPPPPEMTDIALETALDDAEDALRVMPEEMALLYVNSIHAVTVERTDGILCTYKATSNICADEITEMTRALDTLSYNDGSVSGIVSAEAYAAIDRAVITINHHRIEGMGPLEASVSKLQVPFVYGCYRILLADRNHDGRIDLVLWNPGTMVVTPTGAEASLSEYCQREDGRFSSRECLPPRQLPPHLRIKHPHTYQ